MKSEAYAAHPVYAAITMTLINKRSYLGHSRNSKDVLYFGKVKRTFEDNATLLELI